MKYSWCYALALRYRKRVKNAKSPSKSLNNFSISTKFSRQAYRPNEIAFALSPLNLDCFKFNINPMVENMHSIATDEALLVSSDFCDWFQVFKLHMDLPDRRGFSSISSSALHCRYDVRYVYTNCFFNRNVDALLLQQTTALANRFRLVIMAASWAVLYFDELSASASDSTWSWRQIKVCPSSRPVP